MTPKELYDMAKADKAENFPINLSKFMCLDKKGGYDAILDVPIIAMASSAKDKEVRLCIESFPKQKPLMGRIIWRRKKARRKE